MPDSLTNTHHITAAEAIRLGLEASLRADDSVFLMGEGVADPKGIFGTTVGLVDDFGPARVVEMPVSENGLTGVAIGAAMVGQRPVLIHQRVEFCLLAMEQLINNAAKAHYVSNGKHRVPLVVRMIIGRGWGQGPMHSQALETLFAAIPGLKVVMPARPADAQGLLMGAIEDDNPVCVIEHRWIHYATGDVPIVPRALPLDGPKRLRNGKDVTIVASSYMTLEARHAATELAAEGIETDLFDLRIVRPLVLDEIIASVKRTGRLIVVDTGTRTLGPGAEIAAQVTEACFGDLAAAPVRIGLPDTPTPSARSLAQVYYPTAATISDAACKLVGAQEAVATRISQKLETQRGEVPFDIPHPAFKGPF
ncbi:MAG: alpha-ketoacid dehydrogenase subunit beta [Magnetovibrionaceae bacterium]